MLAIDMLPAGHGDALVVEWGTRSDVHRLLVDAGTFHSWAAVRARLLARRRDRYEAFVVTHVDEDHIGGALELMEDPDLRHRVPEVWFNGYVHLARGGDVLGPVQGERLTRLIAEGGYRWNEPFRRRISRSVGGPAVVPAGTGPLPSFPLPGGAVLHLLSPSPAKLKKMEREWATVVRKAGLVPGEGADVAGRAPRPHDEEVAGLPAVMDRAALEALAAPSTRDRSEANGSSIAFLVEFDGKRALLGADAHDDVLVDSLHRFGRERGEDRVRIDLCKLPHHGSAANVTTDLVEAMAVRKYLVSSNGDNHGHPDAATMARLLVSSSRPATICCNHAGPHTEPWVARAAAVGAKVVLPAAGKAGLRVTA